MEDRNMHIARPPLPSLLLAAASLFAFGCTPSDNEQPPQRTTAAAEAARKPEPAPLPLPQTSLDREDVILAALGAATAAALGEDDSAAQAELKGRRFEVRIRFGCYGSDKLASSGWSHDAAKGVLRARVGADINSDILKASDLNDGTYEGAVGFTLRRPWMLVEGCPDPRFMSMADGPAIAIAQLFTPSDSRVERPEASYEAVAQVTPTQLPIKGLNLVLSGRLKPLTDGRAIRCAASDGPPACIISSIIDRVAIEDPVRKVTLAAFGQG
jgi:hypothetical protein